MGVPFTSPFATIMTRSGPTDARTPPKASRWLRRPFRRDVQFARSNHQLMHSGKHSEGEPG